MTEITQADRDAAAPFGVGHGYIDCYDYSAGHMIRTGHWDHKPLVQAFAHHRIAAEDNMLLRCARQYAGDIMDAHKERDAAYERGRQEERAAIVEWLRGAASDPRDIKEDSVSEVFLVVADAIECGDHRAAKDAAP